MTSRVWLVRHASTDWTGHRWCGRTDIPLSAQGREEASALGVRLRTLLPDGTVILSSPLVRASETAKAIARARLAGAEKRGAPQGRVEIVLPLIEIDFGAVDGRTWAEVERDLSDLAREILAARQPDWPDGETADHIKARVESVRRLIAASSTPVVLVSHAAILGALIGALTQSVALGRVALAPGAVLELRRQGGSWQPITGRS